MNIDHHVDYLIQKLADVRFDIAKHKFHTTNHSTVRDVIDEVDDDILDVLIKLNTLVDNTYNFPTGVRKDGTRYFKNY